ncbi:MAG: hypothetical protein L6U99_05635 [Clostridium sp.]|nr:MAG: hypothetical protein L6U99_05635 [Clostridium sp.]
MLDNNLLKAEFVKKNWELVYHIFLLFRTKKQQPLENKMADLIIKNIKLNKLKLTKIKEYEATLFRIYNMVFL